MDFSAVLIKFIETTERAAGSKRFSAFLTWLVFLGFGKPTFDEASLTAAVLVFLCLLFQADAGDDVDTTPVAKKE